MEGDLIVLSPNNHNIEKNNKQPTEQPTEQTTEQTIGMYIDFGMDFFLINIKEILFWQWLLQTN